MLPPSQLLQSSPLQALCGLLGLHSPPSAQPWTSTALISPSSTQTKFYCCFSASEPQLMDWSIREYLASSSLDSAWEQQQQKGSQLPLFSMHILYAEIAFARATTDRKQKILAPGCWQGKLFPLPTCWQGIFFLFSPFSHQYFYIGNCPYNRMLARLTQGHRHPKAAFFFFC